MPKNQEIEDAVLFWLGEVYFKGKDYESCLLKASQAKAEASILISLLGVEKNDSKELCYEKLDIVEEIIAQEQGRDVFPILGYSYYEYSDAFLDVDPYSGLIFAEYGLAFSDVSGYFPPKRSFRSKPYDPALGWPENPPPGC